MGGIFCINTKENHNICMKMISSLLGFHWTCGLPVQGGENHQHHSGVLGSQERAPHRPQPARGQRVLH